MPRHHEFFAFKKEKIVHGDSNISDLESRTFRLNLKYLGEAHLELRGNTTGELYSFSTDSRVQPVDLRDAKLLLASPLFTIA
jgi:hypothetical protein